MAGRTPGDTKISDDAVKKATGSGWKEWFSTLDRLGASERGHKWTAKELNSKHGVSGWWAQMITVQYERERGVRAVNQRIDGSYQLSVSRVIKAPVRKAWDAFATTSGMDGWFTHAAEQSFEEGGTYSNGDGDHGEFTRIVPNKRIRFTWNSKHHKPGSRVEVSFASKGSGKCQVVLQHTDLSSKKEVENLREGWSWAMDSLRSYLETGKPIKFDDWQKAR